MVLYINVIRTGCCHRWPCHVACTMSFCTGCMSRQMFSPVRSSGGSFPSTR